MQLDCVTELVRRRRHDWKIRGSPWFWDWFLFCFVSGSFIQCDLSVQIDLTSTIGLFIVLDFSGILNGYLHACMVLYGCEVLMSLVRWVWIFLGKIIRWVYACLRVAMLNAYIKRLPIQKYHHEKGFFISFGISMKNKTLNPFDFSTKSIITWNISTFPLIHARISKKWIKSPQYIFDFS